MRKRFQRVMAWMLTVLMILTYIPTDVWASGQNVQENEVQQEETDLSALSNESKEKSDESRIVIRRRETMCCQKMQKGMRKLAA